MGSSNINEIKNHRFFKGIDWDNLRERRPPIKIVIKDPKDFVHLDDDRKISDKSWNTIIRQTHTNSVIKDNNNKSINNNNIGIKKTGSNRKEAGISIDNEH